MFCQQSRSGLAKLASFAGAIDAVGRLATQSTLAVANYRQGAARHPSGASLRLAPEFASTDEIADRLTWVVGVVQVARHVESTTPCTRIS